MSPTVADYLAIWDPETKAHELGFRCNLCEFIRDPLLSHPKEVRERYGFKVCVETCERCGLVYFNPRMTADAYAELYGTGAYRKLVSAFWGREINAQTLQPEQRIYAEEWAPWLEEFIGPEHYSYLDIGGSTGVVANVWAKRFKLHPTVIDPAPLELDMARANGCEVVLGTAESIGSYSWRFDFISLCQSVDHLLDPMAVLKLVRHTLRPRGRFFVDIVDYDVTKELKIDHPFNFTPRTIERYLAEAGFDVLAKRRANDGKHVGYICR